MVEMRILLEVALHHGFNPSDCYFVLCCWIVADVGSWMFCCLLLALSYGRTGRKKHQPQNMPKQENPKPEKAAKTSKTNICKKPRQPAAEPQKPRSRGGNVLLRKILQGIQHDTAPNDQIRETKQTITHEQIHEKHHPNCRPFQLHYVIVEALAGAHCGHACSAHSHGT